MNATLGIVVPVRDGECTLRRQVQDLLDILPDVAANFRVMIVDDGSSDSTEEIAHELATTYPQVRVVRRDPALGISAAQTGINELDADLVYVQETAGPVRVADLRAAIDHRLLGDPEAHRINGTLMRKLVDWGRALEMAERTRTGRGSSEVHPTCPVPSEVVTTVRRSRTPVAT